MRDIELFLKANGFKEIESNSFANENCNVVVEDGYYLVSNNYGYEMFSADLNIYWLIGVLTWFDYIPKNYKS